MTTTPRNPGPPDRVPGQRLPRDPMERGRSPPQHAHPVPTTGPTGPIGDGNSRRPARHGSHLARHDPPGGWRFGTLRRTDRRGAGGGRVRGRHPLRPVRRLGGRRAPGRVRPAPGRRAPQRLPQGAAGPPHGPSPASASGRRARRAERDPLLRPARRRLPRRHARAPRAPGAVAGSRWGRWRPAPGGGWSPGWLPASTAASSTSRSRRCPVPSSASWASTSAPSPWSTTAWTRSPVTMVSRTPRRASSRSRAHGRRVRPRLRRRRRNRAGASARRQAGPPGRSRHAVSWAHPGPPVSCGAYSYSPCTSRSGALRAEPSRWATAARSQAKVG